MAFDYSRSVARANRLIAKFGQSMTLERQTNAGTPSRPAMVKATSAVTAVIFDKDQRDATGQVTQTRQMAYIAPSATTAPLPNDVLVASDGQRFEIVSVSPLNPGGTVVMYQADIGTA